MASRNSVAFPGPIPCFVRQTRSGLLKQTDKNYCRVLSIATLLLDFNKLKEYAWATKQSSKHHSIAVEIEDKLLLS
jgi:hypothetical protein